MKTNSLLIVMVALLVAACGRQQTLEVTVSPEVVHEDYLGNGVEWDPYDEAESWGCAVSEEDWQKLFRRLDIMRPQYVRCMINSPYRYYNPATGQYDKMRNFDSLARLLRYCTEHGITVVYGEYNPPTWEMKDDSRWVDMAVDYLNFLVNESGFSCIKYFVIFNEPDGNWASTNGDYELWKNMLLRFHRKMSEYPGLADKVKLAGPDAVVNYKNAASPYDAEGWVRQCATELDSLIGIYDIHAYPGQHEVRSGSYADILARHKQWVPAGKNIILGEAGYKYRQAADSLLQAEYDRRVEGHPFTRGSDCNMLVYDYFYGLDMPLLAMEVMNAGYAGLAAWMLDDAMHSNGDSGRAEDVKIWGMWNILGEEVFGKPAEEEVRPWFYTWSLMCRYFPGGTDILRSVVPNGVERQVYAVAGRYDGQLSVALVNVGDTDCPLRLRLPSAMPDARLYVYEENQQSAGSCGAPLPVRQDMQLQDSYETVLKARSFQLLTNLKD